MRVEYATDLIPSPRIFIMPTSSESPSIRNDAFGGL